VGSWVLVPCLVALRHEFDQAGPTRDRSSDGSIGNQAHAQSSSDHNPDETGITPYEDGDDRDEVHAIDVDDSGPWRPGFDFDDAVEHVRAEHAAGRDNRLQNIIRNRRIASRSWGWTWRKYTGPSPHTEHAHFSARYTTAAENDTSPWGVYREVIVTTQFNAEDKTELKAAATAGVLAYTGGGLPSWPGQPTSRNYLNAFAYLFSMVAGLQTDVAALVADNASLRAQLDSITQDPADMSNPETHPIVRAIRYANANPPAAA
jgi:hypothetical protein